MLDYYQILGISRQSDIPEIKKAYKTLAFKYHPDRNPDNPVAEEKIKQINEAYAVLSDPYKKASHDLLLNYSEQKQQAYSKPPPRSYNRPPRPKEESSVYDRYGKYIWNERPKYHEAPAYKIDKSYVKDQMIAIIAVAIFALLIIGVLNVYTYFEEREELRITRDNDVVLARAQAMFDEGEYRPAIELIISLTDKYPIRHRLSDAKKKMVDSLNVMATELYNDKSYADAANKLEVVRDFEHPMHIGTWKMIADCFDQMDEYRKALHAYDYILMREEHNVELMIKMGDIYYEHLNMTEKALEYYSKARQTFRKFQIANYGEAFELVMRPENIPSIYYNMFTRRALFNSELNKYEEAIKDYNWAIFLKPDISNNYHLRGMCRFNSGNLNRACTDWGKAIALGNQRSQQMRNTHCN